MSSIKMIRDIISKYYVTREISDSDEFKEVCRQKIDSDTFDKVFNQLIELHDGDFVGDIFQIGFVLNFFKKTHLEPMKKLLCMNWHKSHEDIVGLFQRIFNENAENLDSLSLSIKSIPKYLRPEDFKYPYIRKIIYAIGAQPEPYNIEALEELAKTNDEQMKNLVLNQIKKRKELGRWEFKKNVGSDRKIDGGEKNIR